MKPEGKIANHYFIFGMDRVITIFLHVFSGGLEITGYFFLLLIGYGWLWGPAIPYAVVFRNPAAAMRLDGFYCGLAVVPILTAYVVSLLYGNYLIVLLVGGGIAFALLLNRFFKRNVFIPLFCGTLMMLLVATACIMRLSILLLVFFFYVALVLLGPLLLGLLLTAL